MLRVVCGRHGRSARELSGEGHTLEDEDQTRPSFLIAKSKGNTLLCIQHWNCDLIPIFGRVQLNLCCPYQISCSFTKDLSWIRGSWEYFFPFVTRWHWWVLVLLRAFTPTAFTLDGALAISPWGWLHPSACWHIAYLPLAHRVFKKFVSTQFR